MRVHRDYTLLEAAIHAHQGEDVLGHLVEHVDVNLYSKGLTLLHQAILADNVPAATLLLHCGANVLCNDERKATPLHLAKSAEAALLLLRRGACVEWQRYDGATPLHTCGLSSIARVLVQHKANVHARTFNDDGGAQVNVANTDKFTPLHVACSFGRWRVAIALLERSASLDALDRSGRTPSDVVKAVRSLLFPLNMNDKSELDRTLVSLDVWAAGRRRGDDNRVIYEKLVWHALRPVCRDPKCALVVATRLPLDLVNSIVIQWLGPWAPATA
ncbi:hypothetical protein, variant [Aphanomyces invadans]|uniref:Uncharacterized protein n=1 Tax=Aphanomyces invadans TaxID=157072 RepID=A0A024UQ19_9STRA|nr:hypothetical protein, variant [Aphanomyces invadans]ETW08531.1 hypothetical protein, variant [Aphanomyces invadans]|eukprot:XP_008862336.1 hypothetical protein, variant [Aphanomyces invadans]